METALLAVLQAAGEELLAVLQAAGEELLVVLQAGVCFEDPVTKNMKSILE